MSPSFFVALKFYEPGLFEKLAEEQYSGQVLF